jgi:hypothetical protein
MFKHPETRLDASVESWLSNFWINDSLFGILLHLLVLFTFKKEPNADDPLNKGTKTLTEPYSTRFLHSLTDVARLMLERPKDFERNVRESLRGGTVAGRRFPKLL